MKILFICSSIAIVGVFIYFGVHQYKSEPNQNAMVTENPVPNEQQNMPDPEGEKITTPEGLSIQDITFGTGETAQNGDTIIVHYVGSLNDGKVFDASTARGEPFSFTLGAGDVIKGWDIGVLGMKEGGVRELVIPANLAYGENTVGSIPAGSELTFLIQLIQVEKK